MRISGDAQAPSCADEQQLRMFIEAALQLAGRRRLEQAVDHLLDALRAVETAMPKTAVHLKVHSAGERVAKS